jgi:hypothetical protein
MKTTDDPSISEPPSPASDIPPAPEGTKNIFVRDAAGTESVQNVKHLKVTGFAQLKQLAEATFPCRFLLDSQLVELELRRLTPAEQAEIQKTYHFNETGILRSRTCLPPQVKDAKGVIGYDLKNPKYQAELQDNYRLARALVIYAACPVIQAERAGLKEKSVILEYIENLPLGETALEVILWSVLGGGLRTAELVNFTSPTALPED